MYVSYDEVPTVVVAAAPRNADDLVAGIERRIASGDLTPGDRVEPVRNAAEALGLSANTVAAAYRKLGIRGVLIGRGRRGTFVAPRPAIRTAIADPVPPGVIDLSNGNPDASLLPDLGETLHMISTEHTLYGDPPIDPDLERLMRLDFQADQIDATHVAVVGGALDGIERVLAAHLRVGDRVGVEDPGYSAVIELVAAMGFRPVPVGIDQHGPIPRVFADVVAAGVESVIVTPRAQNPTGAALDAQRARELAEVVRGRPDLLIIEDDHAGPVSGQRYRSTIAATCERWAVVRSTAKSLGPDLRLALMAGDPTTIGRVAGRQALGTGWVSHLLQRCAAQMIGSNDTATELSRVAGIYTERRNAVIETLNERGVACDARSGLNVWIPVGDEAAVVAAMQSRGWAIRSGARYRIQAGPGVRLSIAAQPADVLHTAATELAEVLNGSTPTTTTRSV